MSGSHHRQPSYPTHPHPHHHHHHSSGTHHHSISSSGQPHPTSHSHSHSHSSHHRQPSSHHRQPSYHHNTDLSPPSSSSTVGGSNRPGHPAQLGTPGPLSVEDLAFLRQQQRHLGISPAGSSSSSNPGNSAPGLSLDPNALTALSAHFDNLLVAIAGRVQTLSSQTLTSTQSSHRHASHIVDRATVEIENLRDILRQCDELETEFLKIKRLGEMVKGFRGRIEVLERRVGR